MFVLLCSSLEWIIYVSHNKIEFSCLSMCLDKEIIGYDEQRRNSEKIIELAKN